MLSVWPTQFLALFAYFLLRLFVGGILLYLGFHHAHDWRRLRTHLTVSWWPFSTFSVVGLIIFELVTGAMILVGAYTQVATVLVAIMALKFIVMRHLFPLANLPSRLFYLLLLGACLSLTITGAGALAFDLPL